MKNGIKIILASVLILLILFGVMFISKNNKIKSEIKAETNFFKVSRPRSRNKSRKLSLYL